MSAGPLATLELWAGAWDRLDAVTLAGLFAPDATYVGALTGELSHLARQFRVAARAWRRCRILDLDAAVEEAGHLAVARATYRFTGTTWRGNDVAYDAVATFVLRREEADGSRQRSADGPSSDSGWRIARFHESHRSGSPPGG